MPENDQSLLGRGLALGGLEGGAGLEAEQDDGGGDNELLHHAFSIGLDAAPAAVAAPPPLSTGSLIELGSGLVGSKSSESSGMTEMQEVEEIPRGADLTDVEVRSGSGALAPTQVSTAQSNSRTQKNHLYHGRNRALRTGERSSHGTRKQDQDRAEHRAHADQLGREEPRMSKVDRAQDRVVGQEVPLRHDVRGRAPADWPRRS